MVMIIWKIQPNPPRRRERERERGGGGALLGYVKPSLCLIQIITRPYIKVLWFLMGDFLSAQAGAL